jgi:hypothetical protein
MRMLYLLKSRLDSQLNWQIRPHSYIPQVTVLLSRPPITGIPSLDGLSWVDDAAMRFI